MWKNGEGYFRERFHVYANNNNLAQGYQGYSRFNMAYQWDGYNERHSLPTTHFPKYAVQVSHIQGSRSFIRGVTFRRRIHKSALHELELPPEPLFDSIRPERWKKDCGTHDMALLRRRLAKEPTFTKMLDAIREGALRPPKPSLGPTVPDADGNPMPLEQAIADAERAGNTKLHGFLQNRLKALTDKTLFKEMNKTLRRRF